MRSKILLSVFCFICLFSAIIGMFWYQEWKYLLPTPVPQAYQAVWAGQKVEIFEMKDISPAKPIFLHFFNPDCPCSKFNFEHFRRLVAKYQGNINFCVVLQTIEPREQALAQFHQQYHLNVPVLLDADEALAKACGVYSTPQAVILSNTQTLYFRGNYNRSRYCTDPGSNFAQMAIDSILAGSTLPHFSESASKAYGCALPNKNISTLF